MKVIAVVPVKGSSVRVLNKNTRPFNGEPLFVFTLRKLLRCEFIHEVYLDSESDDILAIGKRLGANLMKRDIELADNKTDGNRLFLNEISNIDGDIFIQHLCTSPFIKEETIRAAVDTLLCTPSIDSVVLGKKEKYYWWINNVPAYEVDAIPNSIDLQDETSEAMGLYVSWKQSALKVGRRIGTNPRMLFGDPLELIDVNTEQDLELAKVVAAGFLAEEGRRLRLLASVLSTPVLSDVMDDLGLGFVLPNTFGSNISGGRLFGRARTLHLREAKRADPPNSIYEALNHYSVIVANDIVVVQNDRPDLAYFGELNMSLAVRSGAVGALIGGVTRDSAATRRAQFPVFSKGHYCKDIKGKGAVQSINEPVIIDNTPINPSDLIFADDDGVLVVPRKYEYKILSNALKVVKSESRILSDVLDDTDVVNLVEKHGFF